MQFSSVRLTSNVFNMERGYAASPESSLHLVLLRASGSGAAAVPVCAQRSGMLDISVET